VRAHRNDIMKGPQDPTSKRIADQLDTLTTASFSVLKVARERNQPELTVQAVDRLTTLLALRWVIAERGGGGHA
jgi:hypothetical protein